MNGRRGPKNHRYSIWDNATDRLILLDATADEVCRTMGVKKESFFSVKNRPGGYRTYTVIDTTNESEDETVNQATIIGNLTKDPELRSTSAGISVCGFTVAVNRPKTQNNPEPGADFFNVSAWRTLGEACHKWLTKGSKVCVVGPVSVKEWDSNGKHGASLEIKAEDVEFLSVRN